MKTKHKRGDIRADGMRFLRYRKARGGVEYWVSETQFQLEAAKHRARQLQRYRSSADVRLKNKLRGQAWAKANVERVRAYKKEWERENSEKVRERARRKGLRASFNMTIFEYDKLLMSQNGVCAICSRKCTTGKRLAVDHCHTTGKIRGLLCQGCNTSLGKFNDDYLLVQKAADYLKLHAGLTPHTNTLNNTTPLP